MGYRLGKTLEHWMQAAYEHAPLGPDAVATALRDVAGYAGVQVLSLQAEPQDGGRSYFVTIKHRDEDKPGERAQLTAFEVQNARPRPTTDWQKAQEEMYVRQAGMPPHLRGRRVNVTEEQYRKVLADVLEATGYQARLGDFWVADDGMGLNFGYLTRWGELAFHRYVSVKNIQRFYDIDLGEPHENLTPPAHDGPTGPAQGAAIP